MAALGLAAAGFIALETSGNTDTPVVPPGLVVILGAVAVIAWVRARWAPIAGVVAGVFNLFAMFVVDADGRLTDTSPAVAFVGSWAMVLGLIGAVVAGGLAVSAERRLVSPSGS